MQKSQNSKKNYKKLLKRVKKISNIGEALGFLRWDQEVMMPEKGTPARAMQISTLSSLQHELFTAKETGALLRKIESSELSEKKQSVIREVKREYKRAKRVPNELIEEISETTSKAIPAWEEAKEKDDFSNFSPFLKKTIELKKKYAEKINPDKKPYEVLFEDYEPYISLDKTEKILKELREELVPFIQKISSSEADINKEVFNEEVSENTQKELVKEALNLLGFKWDRGRLDVSAHPFTEGNQFDTRITTRFQKEPLEAIMSTIHEFGHATYTLGLPQEEYGTPLGESRDLSIHESQSRLWENHVGRSKEFWRLFLPKIKEKIPSLNTTLQEVYESVNQVYNDNPIRIEADELTYHMHIVVRFETERKFMEEDLEVDEIPQYWNRKMEKYLKISPENDSEGCLQDIHWAHGGFGYFPTYSLGSVLSAQIYEKVDSEIDNLQKNIAEGNFQPLKDWLRKNIHRHGKRYTTNELIKKSTGKSLSSRSYLEYIKRKYGKLYKID